MNPEQITTAFTAGLISFFAPCVIPLFPTYISVISGFSFTDLYGLEFNRLRSRIFLSSLVFSLFFSSIFTLIGATGFLAGRLIESYLPIILRFNGLFLIVLGLIQAGIIKFDALRFDFAWNVQKKLTKLGLITAAVTGIAAALSWLPCIGPLLSPILLLAAQSQTATQGASLLFVYSLGLTLPFLSAGFIFPALVKNFRQHAQILHKLSLAAGVFMIIFGIILVLGQYQSYILLFEEFTHFLN